MRDHFASRALAAASLMCTVVLAGAPMTAAAAAPARDVIDLQLTDDAGNGRDNARAIVTVTWPTAAAWKAHDGIAPSRVLRAGAGGHLSFKLGVTKLEKAAIEGNGGTANVVITPLADDGTPGLPLGITRYTGQDRAMIARERAGSAPGRTVKVGIGAGSAAASRSDIALRAATPAGSSARTRGAIAASQTASASADAVTTAYVNCVNYRWETEEYWWGYTKIGKLNSAGDTKWVRHEYGTRSDTYIDIGFKAGTDPWMISGMAHSGESLEATFGLTKASNFHYNVLAPFDYIKSYLYADCMGQSHAYMSKSMVEEAGYHTANNLHYSYVVTQPARDKTAAHASWSLLSFEDGYYSRTTGTFGKIGGAVTAFGVSLGAQSGASVYSRESWQFGTSQHKHYLYGASQSYKTAPVIYASNS